MLITLRKVTKLAVVAGLLLSSSLALASGSVSYHVTITNLTNATTFTPILVASHRRKISLFELGSPASKELTEIAEGGNIGPLTGILQSNSNVIDVQNSAELLADGLLRPGESVTVVVKANHGARFVSIASMMLPTNDGFIALDSVRAPWHGSLTYFSPGYDSGTELNDENCLNIPGPTCGGIGPSPGVNDTDEGYVHINRGIHGIKDLDADVYDWRNPVAKFKVTRIRHY